MTRSITIDPVTRIEGHLRLDVEVEDGTVADAWVSATMFRGLEMILQGRDAREAWLIAQRICGVCTTVHAIASVRAVEDALGLAIPPNAQLIRNMMLIHHALRDHSVHFYQLSALDWIDVPKAAKARAAAAASLAGAQSSWIRNSAAQMEETRTRTAAMLDSGQLGIFDNGYWGHPGMHLAPEPSLVLLTHYIQALEFQRRASQIVAMLGGKTPHIQNLAVGGVTNALDMDDEGSLGVKPLESMRSRITDIVDFTREVYFVDACMLAGAYPEWFDTGAGIDRYLALPDLPRDAAGGAFDLAGGTLSGFPDKYEVAAYNSAEFRRAVSEDATHAYYHGGGPMQPWHGETRPELTEWQPDKKYSWCKAARYNGQPVEVGPLADVLIGYLQGNALIRKWTDTALDRVSSIAGRRIGLAQLRSTMGRHLARAIRAAVLSELAVPHWSMLMESVARGETEVYNPPQFPSGEIHGVGLHEAPRGALSHWVVVEKGMIRNYQAVVPSTWNASPRDGKGERGPYEAALKGTQLADPERPLEILRTVHSFDPCMACACHAFDAKGRKLAEVKVL